MPGRLAAYDALPGPVLVGLLALYVGGFAATTGLSVLALAKLLGRASLTRPAWLFGSVDRTMAVAISIGVGLVLIDQIVKTQIIKTLWEGP